MRRLVSRISNSSSFVSWLLKSMMLGHTNIDGGVDLTTPLGHETIRSSFDWCSRTRIGERPCVSVSSKRWACFSSVLCVSIVAMPTGYKIVISRALGCMAFIALNPQAQAPSGFGAINAIHVHPSRPWYNYYMYMHVRIWLYFEDACSHTNQSWVTIFKIVPI